MTRLTAYTPDDAPEAKESEPPAAKAWFELIPNLQATTPGCPKLLAGSTAPLGTCLTRPRRCRTTSRWFTFGGVH
jgi:hypothetical protein